ncbi:hypothetical protein [Flavobacterium selenitireducens]|uniref:hypothetical protein n=1 Tax=Flavobacterium selenitireducens TaxID=2722704 RepID=UPI00168C0ED2|nr:hypothetical protein [Flavobacterium selenitireducens]MBD3581550.1 hypothetical protein [Flavobacterium selenitireducens]
MKSFHIIILLILSLISSNSFAQNQKERKGYAVSVNLKFDEAEMTKEEFQNATFGVHSFYPEMVGRVGLKAFTVKYPGQKEIKITGNKLSDEAILGLKKLKAGDVITVFDALSEPVGDYRVEIRGPMLITLQ